MYIYIYISPDSRITGFAIDRIPSEVIGDSRLARKSLGRKAGRAEKENRQGDPSSRKSLGREAGRAEKENRQGDPSSRETSRQRSRQSRKRKQDWLGNPSSREKSQQRNPPSGEGFRRGVEYAQSTY